MGKIYFTRAARGRASDIVVRSPELAVLRDKTVAVVGLGCIGGPIAIELSRIGIRQLRVVDNDMVDPATTGRWPLGLSAGGALKVDVVRDFVLANYPGTEVVPCAHRVGAVRFDPADTPGDAIIDRVLEGVDLVIDATAESGVQHFLAETARVRGIAYIGVSGSYGGWGGRTFRFRPKVTEGCWLCFRHACSDGSIEEPPAAASAEVQPPGCDEPTFTGAGFDMASISLWAVRVAVSTLSANTVGGYPPMDWDATTIRFRDDKGKAIPPTFTAYQIRRHGKCPQCNPH